MPVIFGRKNSARGKHGKLFWLGQSDSIRFELFSEMRPLMPRKAAVSAHSLPASPAGPKKRWWADTGNLLRNDYFFT